MADLMKLAERVEALSGPERAVDWELHVFDGLVGVGMYGAHPHYTASLAAAMTLVPEGWDHGYTWQPGSYPHMKANGQCWTHKEASTVHGDAATPALALCAAALRARASNG